MDLFLFLGVCIRSYVEYIELIVTQISTSFFRWMHAEMRVKIKWNFISLQIQLTSLVPHSLKF